MTSAVELIGVGVAFVVLWLAHSAYRPYAQCLLCRGSPRNSSATGRTWRKCWLCGGKGERLRIGKRLIDNVLGRRS